MQRLSERIKRETILLSATILYAVTVWLVFPYLRYYVDNPDTISYLTIAEKYATGDFALAVNGYWSPLLSWMLAFVIKWMANEILAFKVLQLLIGWFALYQFISIAQEIIHSITLRYIIVFASVPFMVSYSLLNLTPDLLFLAVVMFYLRMVSEREFFNYRNFGLIAGVFGLLLYFSKSFGFVFFLTHFSVLIFRSYLVTKEYAFKKHLRRNYLMALTAFFLISSIWVYLISAKYGHLTISENVYMNLSREVVAGPEMENKLPILSGGLYKPGNFSAVNAWENPETAVNFTPLHPLTYEADKQLYKQVLTRNLLAIYYFDFRNQTGLIFLLLLLIFLFTRKRKKTWTDDYFFSMLIALVFVYAGYSLILVHARYTWLCNLLMLLLSAWLLEELFSEKKFQKIFIPIAGFFLALLAVKRPVKEILFTHDKPILFSNLFNAVLHPVPTIKHTYYTDLQFFSAINEMKKVIAPGENIISLEGPNAERDCYTRTSLLAYMSGAKYFGQSTKEEGSDLAILEGANISHIVTYSTPKIFPDSSGWKVTFRKEAIPLEIYSRER